MNNKLSIACIIITILMISCKKEDIKIDKNYEAHHTKTLVKGDSVFVYQSDTIINCSN